ncbi:hypothetical protein BXZ70DRAFT_1066835 [Cristinia sonorae]|uniref:F-box domain-containing protein n=1 Tax=Cristinia sonorae TaxID=1940300 RepID=A0A8K0UHW8_9AGAR|nr:hypothetical protein BXZ70DRAFT_1066835 [Cristinia sonorae]
MLPNLPDELFREIIKHASKHDLSSLSRTSKALQTDAEHYLYRHIESSRWLRTEDLCTLIIDCPRFHPLVRSISIGKQGMVYPPTEQYWNRISELLANLPQLESLRLYDDLSMANDNAWVLDKCIGTLRRLEVDFEFDSHFLAFLHNQPGLREIYWTNSSREEIAPSLIQSLSPTPANFLPAVTELVTNCSTFASVLVNNRSIENLWISGHPSRVGGKGMDYISELHPNAASIKSLRVNFPLNRQGCAGILEELATRVPHLRSLGFIPYFEAKDKDMIAALACFKELQSVATSAVISSDTSVAIAKSCPSLRLVACLHYSYSHEYVFLPVNPLGIPKPVHDPDLLLWRNA